MKTSPYTTEDFASKIVTDGAVYKQKVPEECSKDVHGNSNILLLIYNQVPILTSSQYSPQPWAAPQQKTWNLHT